MAGVWPSAPCVGGGKWGKPPQNLWKSCANVAEARVEAGVWPLLSFVGYFGVLGGRIFTGAHSAKVLLFREKSG